MSPTDRYWSEAKRQEERTDTDITQDTQKHLSVRTNRPRRKGRCVAPPPSGMKPARQQIRAPILLRGLHSQHAVNRSVPETEGG
ncbi:uncharacterized protein L3040_000820 [Drepanopeziza brunnea f. sp. 'multigermtubi']|uniref:uncharacterized protein n=1 Tax=Drepanopeziza brunnea f. sp. 'multigermtubi' TaxID=698441 RepID=UPI00239E66C3|nr:hypothetical protein L3040_000820 [Drepanopeziza brunnea f. sp. 'multigermtubi']